MITIKNTLTQYQNNIVLNGATKTSQEVLVPTANGLILG